MKIELSDERIAEFKEIYKRRYKVELTDEQARAEATNLIEFVMLVYDLK